MLVQLQRTLSFVCTSAAIVPSKHIWLLAAGGAACTSMAAGNWKWEYILIRNGCEGIPTALFSTMPDSDMTLPTRRDVGRHKGLKMSVTKPEVILSSDVVRCRAVSQCLSESGTVEMWA